MRWLALVVCLAGCTDPAPCDGVRDLTTSPASLVLTEQEHPGWGVETCGQCHHVARIHRDECVAITDIDLVAIDEIADPTDPTTCVGCHGDNGVDALREEEP